MKPLLRAVLVVDAGLYAASGVALLLSPLAGVQRALQLTPIEPAMAGQMLGLALLGWAWLSLRGAFDGTMTIAVAKIVGHVTWLAGVLMLVWTIAAHSLWLPPLGIVPNLLIGGLLIVVGLGGARFAAVVRRREIDKAVQAAGDGSKAKKAAAPPTRGSAMPVEPAVRSSDPNRTARGGAASRIERPFAVSPKSNLRSDEGIAPSSAGANAADGSGDVRATQPGSAPRPPFHG